VRFQLGERRRLVGGDFGHADCGERAARVALDRAQCLQLVPGGAPEYAPG
jgi:hypothetical protein